MRLKIPFICYFKELKPLMILSNIIKKLAKKTLDKLFGEDLCYIVVNPKVSDGDFLTCERLIPANNTHNEYTIAAITFFEDVLIIQDMNQNDIVITSDQVRMFAVTALYMYGNNKLFYERLIPAAIIEKTIIDGKSYAILSYASKTGNVYVFKISDVDIWVP